MYYKMSSDEGGEPNVLLESTNNEFALLQEGALIQDWDEAMIDEVPFRFSMRVRRNADGSRQSPRMKAYYEAEELMSEALIDALKDAGVDNFQTFPAEISEEDTGTVIENYMVVNIVGLVKAADSEASESVPFADGEYFDKLVLDASQANGLLLFRLAESKMDIVVHESVAESLKKKNLPFLVLTPLQS